MIFDAVSM